MPHGLPIRRRMTTSWGAALPGSARTVPLKTTICASSRLRAARVASMRTACLTTTLLLLAAFEELGELSLGVLAFTVRDVEGVWEEELGLPETTL